MEKRARIQSEIFLEINSTLKPFRRVFSCTLENQQSIADESIAQFVMKSLIRWDFEKLFQVSALDNARIKTASIVRFALRYLVTVTPSKEKPSLFVYWDGVRDSLLEAKGSAVNEYVGFCAMY